MCLLSCERMFFDNFFPHRNKNQEGVDWITPWYVNSNPNKPVISPINALKMYLCLFTQNFIWDRKKTHGSNQYNRYTKLIWYIIKYNEVTFASYGNDKNLGLHSVWKKGGDFFWSGRKVVPHIITIWLRVGITISGAKDMYMKCEASRDHYFSRKVTGGRKVTGHP